MTAQTTEKREYTCIVCPNGCPLQTEVTADGAPRLVSVTGNLCPRGEAWVRQEIENPVRTISTNVLITGGTLPVASVRTLDPVPLKDIMAVRESLKRVVLKAPVHIGDLVTDCPAGVPCRVIATRNIPAKK